MGTIDVHRPWRAELLEREPLCWLSQTHPSGPVEFRSCGTARSYGNKSGVVSRRRETTRAAGRQSRSELRPLSFSCILHGVHDLFPPPQELAHAQRSHI